MSSPASASRDNESARDVCYNVAKGQFQPTGDRGLVPPSQQHCTLQCLNSVALYALTLSSYATTDAASDITTTSYMSFAVITVQM